MNLNVLLSLVCRVMEWQSYRKNIFYVLHNATLHCLCGSLSLMCH